MCRRNSSGLTTEWIKTYFTEGGAPTEYVTSWMAHSWFLFVLMIYTALLPPLTWITTRSVAGLSRFMPTGLAQALLFISVILGVMIAQKIIQKFGPQLPFYDSWKSLLTSTISYLPLFLLGVAMFMWQGIYDRMHKWPMLWLALAAAFVGLKYRLSHAEITSTLEHLGHMAVTYAAAISVSTDLFACSVRLLSKKSQLVHLMSESAYTVDILHYFFIAWLLLELRRLGVIMPVRMVTAFAVGSVLGVALHVLIVRRSRLAALLVNGKLEAPPPVIKPQAETYS